MDSMKYYDNKYGTTYHLPNGWIETWIDCLLPENVDDIELSILRKIENKRTVILNDDEVSYICEPILRSNYEYHMELIGLELTKKIKTEEDKQELIDLIEEMKEILDNMKVFGFDLERDFIEIEEAAKKQLAGDSLTEEELEYHQPLIIRDIKVLAENLKKLETRALETRTPEQQIEIEEKNSADTVDKGSR